MKVTAEIPLCGAVSAVPTKGFTVKFAGGRLRTEEGVYGYNNGSTSSGDGVSTVINHALWFWPHQGFKVQEVGTLNDTTYTKG